MVWSEEKQRGFAALHDRATRGRELTDAEREELQQMYHELDGEEQLLLTPALRRLDEELDVMRQEKTRLELALQQTQEHIASEEERLYRIRHENDVLQKQVEQLMGEYQRRFGKQVSMGV